MEIGDAARNYAKGIGLELDRLSDGQLDALKSMSSDQSARLTTGDLREAMKRLDRGNAKWLRRAIQTGPREATLPPDAGHTIQQVLQATNSDVEAVRQRGRERLNTLLTAPATRDRATAHVTHLLQSGSLDEPRKMLESLESLERYDVIGQMTGTIAKDAPSRTKWSGPVWEGWQRVLTDRSMRLLGSDDLDAGDKQMLAGSLLRAGTPSKKAYQLARGDDALMGAGDPEVFEKLQETAISHGISLSPLHETIAGTPMTETVGQAEPPLVAEESREALRRFDDHFQANHQTTLKAQLERHAELSEIGLGGRKTLDQSDINDAVRDGTIDELAEEVPTGPGKLKLIFRLRGLVESAESYDRKSGFELNDRKLEQLKAQIPKLGADPAVQAALETVRAEAAEKSLGLEDGQADAYARRMESYMSSASFARRLEGMPADEQRAFIGERMKVLGALDPEGAQRTLRKMTGRQFLERRTDILSEASPQRREEATKSALEQVVGTSNKLGGAAGKISEALAQVEADPNSPQFAAKLKDAIREVADGSTPPRAALDVVDNLRTSGKLGAFLTCTTLFSLDMPDSAMETMKQTKNLASVAAGTQDIAKLAGYGDELAEGTRGLFRGLKPISQAAGPVGDVLDGAINTYEAVEAGQEGDWGDATGKGIAAGGSMVGIGMAVSGSTGWTGVGLVVGLGTAAVGGLVSLVCGESDTESNLENSGLVDDTNVDYIPGI